MTTKGTDNRFRSLTVVGEPGTPATPASGDFKLYVADDGTFFLMDDTGATVDLTASAVTDATISTTDITTNNASTSKHGWLRKLDNNAAHFLDGTGAWSTPGGTPTFVGAAVYQTTTQSVSDSTDTKITFGSESFDTSAFHDTSSNTSRMTVPMTGKYLCSASVFWDGNATNARLVRFMVNNATVASAGGAGNVGSTSGLRQNIATILSLTASDYVEVNVWQNSGGSRTVGSTNNYEYNHFSIVFLGA